MQRKQVRGGRCLVASAVFGMACLPTLSLSAQSGGMVTGTVTDAETGDPIEGASVDLNVEGFLALGETDEMGVFSLEGLPAGEALLTVDAVGYTRFETNLTVVDGSTIELTAELQPVELAGIVGEVFDASSTEPIQGAHITVLVGATCANPSGSLLSLADSDTEGRFTVEDLEPGPVLVDVQASGYKLFQVELDLVAGPLANSVLAPMIAQSSSEPATSCPVVDVESPELPLTGVGLAQVVTSAMVPVVVGLAFLALTRRQREDR